MTSQQIDAMVPPQLRKAMKDAGGDPASVKSEPEAMKAWLKAKFAPKKGPPKVAPVAPVPPKKGPPAPVAKAAPPAAKPPAPKPEVSKEATPRAFPGVPPSLQSFLEQLELRIATVEDQLAISNGRTSVPQPVDPYASIRSFINEEDELMINPVKDVPTLKADQLVAIMRLANRAMPENTPIREMRRQVQDMLEKLAENDPGNVTEEAEEAEEVEEAPQEDDGSEGWKAGDTVIVEFEGDTFDPCKILDMKTKRGAQVFSVFFDADQSVVPDIKFEEILGRSTKKMKNKFKAE